MIHKASCIRLECTVYFMTSISSRSFNQFFILLKKIISFSSVFRYKIIHIVPVSLVSLICPLETLPVFLSEIKSFISLVMTKFCIDIGSEIVVVEI